MGKKTIYTKELRDKFLEEHGSIFTPEDVREFVATNIQIDYVSAIMAFQKRIAQSFIATFRDKQGTRNIFSVGGEDKKYAITDQTRNLIVLEAQKTQLENKKNGYDKSIQKVSRRIFEVKYQVTIFTEDAPQETATSQPS